MMHPLVKCTKAIQRVRQHVFDMILWYLGLVLIFQLSSVIANRLETRDKFIVHTSARACTAKISKYCKTLWRAASASLPSISRVRPFSVGVVAHRPPKQTPKAAQENLSFIGSISFCSSVFGLELSYFHCLFNDCLCCVSGFRFGVKHISYTICQKNNAKPPDLSELPLQKFLINFDQLFRLPPEFHTIAAIAVLLLLLCTIWTLHLVPMWIESEDSGYLSK